MKKKIKWKPFQAKESEVGKLSNLRKLMLDGSDRRSTNVDYYKWKLFGNPYHNGVAMVVENDKNIAGMATITPKSFLISSDVIKSAEIGDTFTHPEYQRLGIFSTLVNNVREHALSNSNIEFLYGTPNENSLPGYEIKLNFPPIASAKIYNYVFPVNVRQVVKRRFSNPLSIIIITSLMVLYVNALRLLFKRKPLDYKIKEVSEISTEMGDLWKYLKNEYDILNIRDKKYLIWRFINNPDTYRVFNVFKESNIIGYFILKEGVWNGLNVCYLADYLFIPGHEAGIQYVVDWILDYSKKNNSDLISCWSPSISPFMQIIKKAGFIRYKKIPIICYLNDLGKKIVSSDFRIYFTMADSDNI